MRFHLTVLGSNGAVPSPGRHGSAHFLSTETEDVLIDCAEGTQMQLTAAGLGFGRVSTVLISHLHGDHYFGLPGLLTSLALNNRTSPLRIISPPGLRDRIAPLLELDRWTLPFELTFQEHTATELAPLTTIGKLEVLSFPLRHRVVTNGYLLRERPRPANLRAGVVERYGIPYREIPAIRAGGDFTDASGKRIAATELTAPASPPRSYAYCSDTVYFDELAHYVRGVDLLYHEATFLHDRAAEAREKGHATAREAALIARAAGVGILLLGHFSSRYADPADHEREARAVFPASHAVRDLRRYVVPYAGREPA